MTATASRTVRPPHRRGAFRMLGVFVRTYPGRSTVALVSVFVASLFEGLGMSMLLSMLSLASGPSSSPPSKPQQVALDVVSHLGIAPTALNLLFIAIVLIALRGAMSLFANRQVGYTVAHIATDLRLTLIRAMMGARWSHYLQQSVGGLSNAVATEAQRASEAFQLGAEMAATVLSSIVYLTVAFSISWEAGIAATVAGAVLLLTMRALIRTSRHAGEHQTQLQKSLLTLMSAQFAAAKPLKAMAREDHVDALLADQTRQLERALRQQVVSKEALTAMQEPMLAIMVGAGFYLALNMLHIPMSDTIVMLFMLARVVSYLSKGQKAYQQVVMRESAYWSMVQAIDEAHQQREPQGGDRSVQFERELRFDAVSYAHGEARSILREQSLAIPARGLTLVIGPSGAGKTTLLDLVVGLRQPDAGRITVDDVPLPELNLRDWRRQIGYVPQESVMVDESVAHNLTLGESIPDDKVREALRAANALEFVESMPEGLATRVGEGGSRLSGGQRQRLAIARALIHQPRLLILDEATSNLDPEAQEAIVDTVSQLKNHMSILAVAHQERLVRVADRVYRLADGAVESVTVAQGRVATAG
ncbi:MAG: ABC transporter ATP-binding protein [Proteobacteria bacterium]|jgi:ATP-binding cassette subfamily C protein|nr:ABC transporter ATP-binding protein [Pseudomonadota bacterium]